VAALATAGDAKTRAELWRRISPDTAIACELQPFSAAVQRRFGGDAVRVMLRSEARLADALSVPRVLRQGRRSGSGKV
jgi:hypothetical protein